MCSKFRLVRSKRSKQLPRGVSYYLADKLDTQLLLYQFKMIQDGTIRRLNLNLLNYVFQREFMR